MKSLYESILASTSAGKAGYEERSIPHVSKRLKGGSVYTYYDVDLDMKTWFQVVSEENFHSVFDGPVQDLRRIRGKRYTEDTKKVGFFFNDGYLEVKLSQEVGPNKNITYNWYFADGPKKFSDAIEAYKENWKTLIEKAKNANGWDWFSLTYSRKEGIKRLHQYMNAYIQYTPKQ